MVNKLGKKKIHDSPEAEFTLQPNFTENSSNLSKLANFLTDTQSSNLKAGLSVSIEPKPKQKALDPRHKISWYERENHRVASKLEKEGITGEVLF